MNDRNSRFTRALATRWFDSSGDELRVGGIPLATLAKHHGTPFYVYDAGIIRQKLRMLRSAVPEFDCFYSVKANPNPAILSLLLQEGCGMEAASEGELQLALACGCPPDRLFFAGPGKTDDEIAFAIQKGIGEIHLESFSEIFRANRIAASLGIRQSVALRINPSAAAQGGAQQMGGKATAFGIDEEELDPALRRIANVSNLNLTGLHVYAGTQILNSAAIADIYAHIVTIARRIVDTTGKPLKMIDFGGGFGVPYFPGEDDLKIDLLEASLKPLVQHIRSDERFQKTRLVVEPGRYVTAESGLYVARVVTLKESRGMTFAVLDGGLNHHLSASGQFGQVIKRNFPILAANRIGQEPVRTYEIAGPLCTPLDILGHKVHLPNLEEGDLIAILQSGAYARTSSPQGFLSHPSPMELLVDHQTATVIRERGRFEELIRGTQLKPESLGSP